MYHYFSQSVGWLGSKQSSLGFSRAVAVRCQLGGWGGEAMCELGQVRSSRWRDVQDGAHMAGSSADSVHQRAYNGFSIWLGLLRASQLGSNRKFLTANISVGGKWKPPGQ